MQRWQGLKRDSFFVNCWDFTEQTMQRLKVKFPVVSTRQGFSLRKIARILDRDISEVSHAWDILTQDRVNQPRGRADTARL